MIRKIGKIVRNPYIFSIISKFFVVIVGFLFTVVQARYLGATIKGQVAYVSSISGITSIILGFGIHQAYPYCKRKSNKDLMPVFIKIAILQLLIYCVLSLILSTLIKDYKIIAVIIITPVMVYERIVSYITVVEEPNRKNTIEMVLNVSELVLIVFFWCIIPASFFVGVFVITFKNVVMAIMYTCHWRSRLSNNKDSITEWIVKLVKFGFFPMLALLMTSLNYRVDIIMLEGRVTDSAIGVYSIGVMLAERVWLIPDAMKEVMISKITKGKDVDEISFVIRVCNSLCLLVMLLLVVIGKPFINTVFGPQYQGAYQVTMIIMIGVFCMIYFKMIASYNIIIGKQVINFIFLGVSVLGNIIANIVLIPEYGIFGAAAASVISYFLCSLMFLIQFHKTTSVAIKDMLFLKRTDLRGVKSKFFKRN